MYSVYNYKAGSTQAQILSDIVAILTGTTSVASLSASCVQANTSIVSTVAAGWSLWDSAAATNVQYVRALNQDGTTYKYLRIDLSSSTAFAVGCSESWNASTHVGTNNTTTQTTSLDIINGGYIYLYASQKNAIAQGWITTSAYGNVIGCLEFSRDQTPSTYPCFVAGLLNGNGNSIYCPRTKAVATTGDQTNVASVQGAMIPFSGNTSTGPVYSSLYRDASENQYFAMYSAGTGVVNGTFFGTTYDYKVSTSTTLSSLDELVYSGTNYVVLKSTQSVLVPKA